MFNLFNKITSINVNEINNINNINLIDIRSKSEYQSYHIPQAKNIEMNLLLSNPSTYLNKDKTYHIVCASGMRSNICTKKLCKAGYNVVNVKGGTNSYLSNK